MVEKKKNEKKARRKVMTKRRKTLKGIRKFLIYAAIFIALLTGLTLRALEISATLGAMEAVVNIAGSMEDSLFVGDYILVDNVSIYAGGPHRGDIATFDYPFIELNIFQRTWRSASKLWGGGDWDPRLLIKRVIGEPGDTILIEDGVLYVNGEPQDEPYLKTDAGADFGPITVPEDHYFMAGDDRYESVDSRYIGAVPRDVIRGKARVIYFSLAPTACPKHDAPLITTPDGELRCAYDGEIMREGYDAVDASPLRFDKRIRWSRIGKVIF
ncbi:MAG: signal peptidase I [Candidatus Coatesbacteria bacterium]|nr:MAG: signal peptidase I [Candidatus Coatesbacteria bacterium]